MADHLSEEEQIEALKNWWQTYWKSVVLPIVVVGAGYLGWNYYEDATLAKAQNGAVEFQALMSSIDAAGAELSEETVAAAEVAATKIVDDFAGSLYADQATLLLARFAVDEKDYASAANYLESVRENGQNRAIQALATARLARVKIAQGEVAEALNLVSASDSEYASFYAEIRGDGLLDQGKVEAAKTAYQEAIDKLDAQDYQRRSLLQFKLDGAVVAATKLSGANSSVETESSEADSADTEIESQTEEEATASEAEKS